MGKVKAPNFEGMSIRFRDTTERLLASCFAREIWFLQVSGHHSVVWTLACSRCATGLGVSCRLRGSAGRQMRRSCLLSRFVSGRAHTCGKGSGHRVWGMRARMHASDEHVIPADVAVVLICPCAPFAMCSELAWRLVVCANVCAEHDTVCVVGAYVGCSAHEPCEWSWPECWGVRAPQRTACSPS